MEIRKKSDIEGVITTEDVVEGRMVLFTSHPGYSTDVTGRLTHHPGVKLPDNATEAGRAKYVLTWKQDRREPPIIDWPAYPFALRQTLDQDANAPITGKTIYLTYPGYQESVTIPSGTLALALGGGVYTVPSGQFIFSSGVMTPGTQLQAANASDDSEADAGKLKELSGGTAVAVVQEFDSSEFSLTFRTLNP